MVSLIAYALSRRDRRSVLVAGASLGAGAAWWAVLRAAVTVSSAQVIEITAPFVGLARAASRWLDGTEVSAAIIVVLAFAIAAAALLRCDDRLTRWMVGVNLAFVTVLSADATGLWANASRTTAPVTLFAILGLIRTRTLATTRLGASLASDR